MGSLPFPRYDPNTTIADLILRSGQQRADMQLRSSDILAGTVAQLGQIPAQIQRQTLEQARTKREETLANVQMAHLKQQQEDRAALDKAMDQGIDPDAIEASLPGHLRGEFRESWNKQQEQKAKYEKGQSDTANAQAEMLANGGRYLKNHLQDPDGGLGAATLWVQTLPKAMQERAGPYLQQVKQNPAALPKILDDFIAQAPSEQARLLKQQEEEYTLKPGEVRIKGGKQIATGGEKVGTEEDFIRKTYGPNPTPQQILEGRAKWAAAGRDPSTGEVRRDARTDKSYQFNSKQLEDEAKPLTEQAEKFNRLASTLNQKTPQADALIAPELLTVMAGGKGSGLRMNEAEISRIVGGRSHWESLKAAVNKWSLDPSKALSVTDEQRQEIRKLMDTMQERITGKVGAINEARRALVDAESVEEHRKILAGLHEKLSTIETPKPEAPKISADQMVTYQGRLVPFKTLPPDIQTKALAAIQ